MRLRARGSEGAEGQQSRPTPEAPGEHGHGERWGAGGSGACCLSGWSEFGGRRGRERTIWGKSGASGLVPHQRWADSGGDRCSHGARGSQLPSARLLTLPSRGGTLLLCLFLHLLPTNTRVVVKTGTGPLASCLVQSSLFEDGSDLPQGLGGSRRSEGTPSIPPPAGHPSAPSLTVGSGTEPACKADDVHTPLGEPPRTGSSACALRLWAVSPAPPLAARICRGPPLHGEP